MSFDVIMQHYSGVQFSVEDLYNQATSDNNIIKDLDYPKINLKAIEKYLHASNLGFKNYSTPLKEGLYWVADEKTDHFYIMELCKPVSYL